VSILIKIMPMQGPIIILICVVVLVFSTMSMQLFRGHLLDMCVLESSITPALPGTDPAIIKANWKKEEWLMKDDYQFVCEHILADDGWGDHGKGTTCPKGYKCLRRENPNFGYTNFDNILNSSLTVFGMFTMDCWTDVMYMIRFATNSYYYDLYFVVLVIVGQYFAVNLIVAV
jgi:hypothetical protein